ncbi:hypothetical protein IMG5_178640 [Ichthyophthirius multifiliis]|uniref:Uncharacterized protein n=1 Tax=Ichthyophthirius multifiliis TaxID=5932 RepID=G0R2J0_ICHMU|nr:hypothetical protein IMG5_178640 [Ichthyophthirius multifiliis]EGR28316.1 hypothetical protein IMG5_178640 [Ichthyophthirius multifiliis]|eukprot:XP_004027661.1 hypothetical protein IMG5_178640 [Ichthyophthirius multifiliis]
MFSKRSSLTPFSGTDRRKVSKFDKWQSKKCYFNAITLALIDSGIPIKDFMISQTVAYLNNDFLIEKQLLEIYQKK